MTSQIKEKLETESQAELKESEHLLRTIFENEPDCINILSEDGTLLLVNPASLDIMEANSLDEVVGKSVYPLISAKYREPFRLLMEGAFLGNKGKLVFEIVGFKGSRKTLEMQAFPLHTSEGEIVAVIGFAHDITKQKDTENSLRESEERIRLLVEGAFEGIVLHNQGIIIEANKKLADKLGYNLKDMVGKNILEYTAPESRELVLQNILSGYENPYEAKYQRKDGRTFYCEVISKPTYYRGEKVHITAIRDISERKQLLELSQALLSTLDLDEIINKILQELRNALPYDTCRILWLDEKTNSLRPYRIVGQERIPNELAHWSIPVGKGIASTVVQTGKSELVNNAHLDPRSIYPEEATITCEHLISIPIRSKEKILGAFNVSRNADPPFTQEEFDLVELFLTHASLAIENARLFEQTKVSEEKYRSLFEETKDMVFISTPEGKFIDINPAGIQLLKYDSKEELLMVDIARDLYWDPNKRQEFLQLIHRQGYVQDMQLELKTKDGQKLVVLETVTTVRDKNGNIVAYRGIIRDITSQRVLEEQFRQSQKMESLGTIAGGIAHDFNNILGIIMGYSAHLEQAKTDPERIAKSLQAIKTAAQRGAGLVRQLLTFARKTSPTVESVNPNTIIEEIAKMLYATFPKTITIDLQLDPNIQFIIADANQLHQALVNLSVNARDAMPKGGKLSFITSIVTNRVIKKQFPEATRSSYVCIRVTDTGVGMDEITRSRIFEPFFTTKERGKGTGLGLSVVYGVVQSHQGFINVQSEIGKGTTFSIYLPMPESMVSDTPEVIQESKEIPGGNETLLIVEDEDSLRELLKSMLESKGYNVLTASDGVEAIETYEKHKDKIAAVISDVGLPRLDGWASMQQIKKLNPSAKIILASGYIDNEILELTRKKEIEKFIRKPYDLDEVASKIRDILDQKT